MDGNNFVSCSDDNTVRFWDKRTKGEVSKLNFASKANGIEINADKSILSICFGPNVMFYDLKKGCEIRTFKAPTTVYTSSLHPNKSVFVCGGEDFLIYKCDFNTFEQIGNNLLNFSFVLLIIFFLESFSGHFGAVHCLRFSPDGEIYASGSEDGTLRLWQNTIGKTYGLWKFVGNEEHLEK